ncbi:MAG: sulfatase-like hydrolase/transferase, partial [Candidatus Marinimicrobia bacterium]|nr:sulfatase-like hydrolase/transferase [Candidatus Neomarinimicrobiota bacterium]
MSQKNTSRRTFLKTTGLGLASLMFAPLTGCSSSEQDQPNVILIMADDLGWGDTAYNGHPELQTPHLDAMAANGLQFDRWYASNPVCSPTRGSCLTGRHPYRYGILSANVESLPAEEITLAEVLKENGYRTGHFGKWHLGTLTKVVKDSNRGGPLSKQHYAPPWEHGFDVCFSTESRTPTYDPLLSPSLEAGPLRRGQEPGKSFQTYYWNGPGQIATENLDGDDSRIIMDRVIPFVRETAGTDRPFFSVVWFHSPHEPVVGDPEYMAKYSHLSEDEQHYYATVTAMDDQIGRLRSELQDLGIADNTMIWFCSDNGPSWLRVSPRCVGSPGPFRERKGSLYEGGVRVPGILEWPEKVTGGRSTDIPCSTSDYYPTILSALGVNVESQVQPVDGIDIMPLINGEMQERPSPIAFQQRNRAALSDNRYKIITGEIESGEYELYDLIADPGEQNNIANDHPGIVASMQEELEVWLASVEKSRSGSD